MRRAGLAVLAAMLVAFPGCRNPEASAEVPRSDLQLVTSLPLLFGEQFSLDTEAPPVVAALRQRYELKAVDIASQLPPRATLLAIQPRALPAEELVKLDQWVRGGGRLVLLADPMLEWHSERPLADPLRAPVMFGDTGLLQHWGLRLDAPDERGAVKMRFGAREIVFASPGRLVKTGGGCSVDASSVMATCRIGKGRVVVVADADWLDEKLAKDGGGKPADQFDQLIELIESVRTAS